MKMWGIIIPVEHPDNNAKEKTNLWHKQVKMGEQMQDFCLITQNILKQYLFQDPLTMQLKNRCNTLLKTVLGFSKLEIHPVVPNRPIAHHLQSHLQIKHVCCNLSGILLQGPSCLEFAKVFV